MLLLARAIVGISSQRDWRQLFYYFAITLKEGVISFARRRKRSGNASVKAWSVGKIMGPTHLEATVSVVRIDRGDLR